MQLIFGWALKSSTLVCVAIKIIWNVIRNLWKLYKKRFSWITAWVAHHLRTAVLMARAFCLQDPRTSKILCRPTLYSSCTQPKTGQLLIPRVCRRRDDGWRQQHLGKNEGVRRRGRGHRLVKARNHHVGRRRDGARCIRRSWLMAVTLWPRVISPPAGDDRCHWGSGAN